MMNLLEIIRRERGRNDQCGGNGNAQRRQLDSGRCCGSGLGRFADLRGLAIRYVTDWAGPATVIRRIATQLKAPTYPGDTLTLSGWIDGSPESGSAKQVHVRATNSLGTHIDSIITIT